MSQHTQTLWSTVKKDRFLLYSLVGRDLREQYTGSFLGAIWLVLRPVAWMAIYSFALSVVLKARTAGSYEHISYPVYLLAGMLPYLLLAEAAGKGVACITGNPNLIKKSMFDKSVLPVSVVISTLVNHCVGVVTLLAVMLCFGLTPGAMLLLLPVVTLLLTLYVLGWVNIVAAINVFTRDMSQILTVVLQLLFFMTPIIYPEDLLPPWAVPVMKVNPHFFFVRFYRQILLLDTAPDLLPFAVVAVGSVLFYLFSHWVFRRLSPGFADLL